MKRALISLSCLAAGTALVLLYLFLSVSPKADSEASSSRGSIAPSAVAEPPSGSVSAVDDAPDPPDEVAAVTESGQQTAVIRSWEGVLEPSLFDIITQFEAGSLSRFSIPTFDGDSVTVIVSTTRATPVGASTLTGTIEGEPGSLVSLAVVDQAEAGGIIIPTRGQTFEIRPAAAGGILFREVDVHALGDCALCLPAPESATTASTQSPQPPRLPESTLK